MITTWQHCLNAAMITRWHYYVDVVMNARWRYCLIAAMITRWQYCLIAAMITRWHYCIKLQRNLDCKKKNQHLPTAAVAYPGFFFCLPGNPPPTMIFFNQGVTPLLAPTLTSHFHLRRSETPLETNSGYATAQGKTTN